MRFLESFQVLDHCWEDICSVFYKRYPNPHSKHVLGEDIIHRTVHNNLLTSTRIFAKTNEVPSWLQKFLPSTTVYIMEESRIDLDNRTITTYTKNLTHKTFLAVEEKCIFTLDNDSSTLVKRHVWLESSFPGLSRVFESFGLSRYSSNISRMHRGFDSVLLKHNGACIPLDSSHYKTPGVRISNTC